MIPEDFVDKLKTDISLLDLVSEYTDMKKQSKYVYVGHCPNPKHRDSSPSFYVMLKGYKDQKYDSWACMGCHKGKVDNKEIFGSDIIAFVRWIENLSFPSAIAWICEKYNISMPKSKNSYLYEQNRKYASKCFGMLQQSLYAKEYLYSRGLDDNDIIKNGLGFDGTKIVFPLIDNYRQVVGFSKRWIKMPEGCSDKYRNSAESEIFQKRKFLYGANFLENSFNEIRITEGAMDMILATKYGAKNVVATLGTAFTEEHIGIIKQYNLMPVFCLDGDEAGIDGMKRSAEILAKNNINCKVLILPKEKDLADMSLEVKEQIEDYIAVNSITYGNFLIQQDLALYRAKLNELNLSFYPKMIKTLSSIPYKEERDFLMDLISKQMNMR